MPDNFSVCTCHINQPSPSRFGIAIACLWQKWGPRTMMNRDRVADGEVNVNRQESLETRGPAMASV